MGKLIEQWSRPVFSAHAEVVPSHMIFGYARCCILRARGGSSGQLIEADGPTRYSPRTRR